MDNLDLFVLRTLRDWRREGKAAWLVTVVRTWGSSPRPAGSVLALCEDGRVVGSVSGGCIEDDLILKATAPDCGAGLCSKSGGPLILTYGVSSEEAHRFGLPCGGTIELMAEPNPQLESLERLVDVLTHGGLVHRRVRVSDGEVTLTKAENPAELVATIEYVINTFGPEYRMLLIGAGQLTEYLATMASFCGFSVTVCDPRVEYTDSWAVPRVSLTKGMPDDEVVLFRPDRRTAVIALTHDPKLDDLALLEALKSEAFYVGAIGSRRNSENRRQRMHEHFDIALNDLEKLRAPVGVFIGSKTPSEIAVSIMAEVLAVKNAVQVPREMLVAPAKEMLNMQGPNKRTTVS